MNTAVAISKASFQTGISVKEWYIEVEDEVEVKVEDEVEV